MARRLAPEKPGSTSTRASTGKGSVQRRKSPSARRSPSPLAVDGGGLAAERVLLEADHLAAHARLVPQLGGHGRGTAVGDAHDLVEDLRPHSLALLTQGLC